MGMIHFVVHDEGDSVGDVVAGIHITGMNASPKAMSHSGDKLLECMLRTANGRLAAAEALGHREFMLTRHYESA